MRIAARALAALVALVVLLVAGGVWWPVPPAPPASQSLDHAIVNVHVIDTASGAAGSLTSVVVRDGRIATIDEAPPPRGVHVVDGGGGFLIPGLWDMHSHSWQISPQLHFPLQIANGVTGVRDMLDCPAATDTLIACGADKRRWSAEAVAGRMVGPRFVGIASFYFESPDLTPADVTNLVRSYDARGLDYLKVYNRLSRPAYFRLAAEARKTAKPIVGHLPKAVSLSEAVAAGQQSVDHAHALVRHCTRRSDDWITGRLDSVVPTALARTMVAEHDPAACDRIFAAMRAKGVWLVPTHLTRQEDALAGDARYLNDRRLDFVDPLSRWAFRDDAASTRKRYPGRNGERALTAYFEHGLRLTGRAHAAGVRVLVGTDTILGGFKLHDELELLVKAGLRPSEALRAATLDAAEYAGMTDTHGSIAVGKRADMVLLRRNPLDEIGNSRAIDAVFLNGHHYDRKHLDALLDYTRRQARHPANWIKMLWGFATSSVRGSL